MGKMTSALVTASLLATGVCARAGSVSVVYVQPETYTDAAYSGTVGDERSREEVRRDIEQHLLRLAGQLAANESLEIEVLDIDLAGRFEPFRFTSGAEPRIMRDSTWPRMKLRYTLRRGDRVLASGEERLSDMNYLVPGNRYASFDRLRYEKPMLDEWFATLIRKNDPSSIK